MYFSFLFESVGSHHKTPLIRCRHEILTVENRDGFTIVQPILLLQTSYVMISHFFFRYDLNAKFINFFFLKIRRSNSKYFRRTLLLIICSSSCKLILSTIYIFLLPVSNERTGWKDKSISATLSLRSCRWVNRGRFGEFRLQSTQGVHESPHPQIILGLDFSIFNRLNNFRFCHCCTDLVLAAVQELTWSLSLGMLELWTFNRRFVLSFSASCGMLGLVYALFSCEADNIPLFMSGWILLFSILAVSASRSFALLFATETTCLCFSRCIGVFLTRTVLYVSSHLRIRRSMSMTCDRSQVHFDAILPRSQ